MSGFRIEVWRSLRDGQWYFRGRARNGRVLFASEGYRRRGSAVKSAKLVMGGTDRIIVKPAKNRRKSGA